MTIQDIYVDDQDLVRAGFAMVLGSQPDLTVAGEAADGAAAIRLAREVPADVMVMDVRMPGLDGVAATREICQAAERPRVLILTTFDLDEYAFAALRAGASGFLLKSGAAGGTAVRHPLAQRLGLRDRIQAVVYAYETGLIAPQGPSKHQGRR